jgi:hypothetical protein
MKALSQQRRERLPQAIGVGPIIRDCLDEHVGRETAFSAPINRALTAAAEAHETPANARALQRDWDRIIVPRAVLQGLAVAALCVSLIS